MTISLPLFYSLVILIVSIALIIVLFYGVLLDEIDHPKATMIFLISCILVTWINIYSFNANTSFRYEDTKGNIGVSNNCNTKNMTCIVDATTISVISIEFIENKDVFYSNQKGKYEYEEKGK